MFNPLEIFSKLNELLSFKKRLEEEKEKLNPNEPSNLDFFEELKKIDKDFVIPQIKPAEPFLNDKNIFNNFSINDLEKLEENTLNLKKPNQEIFKNLKDICVCTCDENKSNLDNDIPELELDNENIKNNDKEKERFIAIFNIKTNNIKNIDNEIYNGYKIPLRGKIISKLGQNLMIELEEKIKEYDNEIILNEISGEIEKQKNRAETYLKAKENFYNYYHKFLYYKLIKKFYDSLYFSLLNYYENSRKIIEERQELIKQYEKNISIFKRLNDDKKREEIINLQINLSLRINFLSNQLETIKNNNGFYNYLGFNEAKILPDKILSNTKFINFSPKNYSIDLIQLSKKIKDLYTEFSDYLFIDFERINNLTYFNIEKVLDPINFKIESLDKYQNENKNGKFFIYIENLKNEINEFVKNTKDFYNEKNLNNIKNIENFWNKKIEDLVEDICQKIDIQTKDYAFFILSKEKILDELNQNNTIQGIRIKREQFLKDEFVPLENKISEWKNIIENFENNQNFEISNNNRFYDFDEPSIIKINNITYYNFLIKGTQKNETINDNNYTDEIKIPKIEDTEITKKEYWVQWCKIATIVNLFPEYWPIGIIIPSSNGLIKIPCPIIWKFLISIPNPFCVIVIGLTICGFCVFPFVYIFNPNWDFPINIVRKNESYFVVGLRGPSKISSNVSNQTFKNLIPEIDKNYLLRINNITKNIKFKNQINLDFIKKLPLEKEDHPPFSKLSIKNFRWVNYLIEWCKAGKKTYGFFEK